MMRTPLLAMLVVLSLLDTVAFGQIPGAQVSGIGAGGPAIGQGLEAPVALSGLPFGVLRVEVPLPPEFNGETPRVLVQDSKNRIFYPVITVRSLEITERPPPRPRGVGRPGGLIDRVRSAIAGPPITRSVPVAIHIEALFRGQEPIDLQLTGDIRQRLEINVDEAGPEALRQLSAAWWQSYTKSAIDAMAGDDAPKLTYLYLTGMLADRFGFPRADLEPLDDKADSSQSNSSQPSELQQPLETLALLSAIEPLREQILKDVNDGSSAQSQADQPLPPEPQWSPSLLPPADHGVPIEAIASRVPPECFYLRFGSFANYIWFRDTTSRYGGDIAQAVFLRGFNYEASARMEKMLASKLTTLSKMFGDKLISDMALIGSDLYLKEGASMGVLFRATQPQLLKSAMDSDRRGALAKNKGATLQDVEIAGRKVSLLSTPDNRVRAFMAVDGDYVLVTTSEYLVRRFLEVGQGDTALAATPGFQWARTWMPDANEYNIFAYFSPEFFHRLVSPQYQIELRRRLQAIAHIELAGVAAQVAVAEGVPAENIEDLQVAGLLPPWFDERADGARTLRSGDRWLDSSRGARASFLPIADVKIDRVTNREASDYAKIAGFYQEKWRRMDPILFGIRRFRGEDTTAERVALEAYIAPFEADKYGWIASQLAEPTPIEILLPADDAASAQVHVRGASGFLAASEDYHLFAGVKDMVPPMPGEAKGLIKTLQTLKASPAYLGAWPKPELIEQMPLGLGFSRPDYAGFSRMIGGLWKWQNQEFSLLSFDKSILDRAIPQLGVGRTNDMAQARARVASLQESQLETWVNRMWFERGLRVSKGNALFLDDIHQQLKVPNPECLDVAQRLLDVKLQCPLGGEFQFEPLPGTDTGWWESTAWNTIAYDGLGKPIPPPGYKAPWIEWFRGGKVHITQLTSSLALVGEFDLEMQELSTELAPDAPAGLLPKMNFDVFELPFKIFGKGQSSSAPPGAVERKSF